MLCQIWWTLVRNEQFSIEGNSSCHKFRVIGAGAAKGVGEVKVELFQYFLDIRCFVKANLPRKCLTQKQNNSIKKTAKKNEKMGRNNK